MRIIIAGSRDLPVSINDISAAVQTFGCKITAVLSGKGGNVDLQGECWAYTRGIPVEEFPADWNKYGKAAGPKRNREMAKNSNGLVLLWDGKSRGSADMKRAAETYELVIYERIFTPAEIAMRRIQIGKQLRECPTCGGTGKI